MGRHKSYDRDEVLEQAMTLFWAKGFEGAHLSELVEVTGVNRFGLYAEFGGKEGLFQEALELYLGRALDAYRATLDAEPLGLSNIRRYFSELTYGDDYHGCFMINTLTEQYVVTSAAFGAASKVVDQAYDLFLQNLVAAQKCGELDAKRDVKTLARFLSTIDSGLSVRGIVSPVDSEKDAIAALALGLLE